MGNRYFGFDYTKVQVNTTTVRQHHIRGPAICFSPFQTYSCLSLSLSLLLFSLSFAFVSSISLISHRTAPTKQTYKNEIELASNWYFMIFRSPCSLFRLFVLV